ncbi:protein translocase subunit SecD [Cutibacterium namnetense]|uniref:Protein translocase subunit SecD n=1 Tax=Cutibacterium namnetense TaxID=1574624 RepID=A0ABX9IBK5_9ACTN|nr:protein translocase subunit SecD [Cutibacterium namnetense]REB70662.1 protein translocase subunit SecD [Cutibacterium namnetense]TKW73228.1 MAG: protein translocase subunit SecD [Cutibacterium acnes]
MIFLVIIIVMYVLMGVMRTWSPKLGLDLRGGTSVTLTAKTEDGKAPPATSLEQARLIIQQRVNALGVGESSVKTMGDRNIVVSAPNVESSKLVEMVGQTAQLGFRMVYAEEPVSRKSETSEPAKPSALPTPSPSAKTSSSPGASASPKDDAKPSASRYNEKDPQSAAKMVKAAQEWKPTPEDQKAFEDYKCAKSVDSPGEKSLVTCDREGTTKYLLSPVAISGTQVVSADSGIPQGQLSYVVNLKFNSIGTTSFSDATTYLCSKMTPQNQFAVVLDGKVISSPQLDGSKGASCPINGGEAQISGHFTQDSAADLANVLKYGALPLSFDISSVDNISPTLGGEQLRAGIIAGIIGLIVVGGYCLLYYRGLGLVTLGSLIVAGITTYAAMVLLGEAVGFTLSLAGIAGAIVAIGVTADSFIVYFERIRDEIREGRTLRTALQTGWAKARGTILMADGVSLLSAVVLFVLSVDQVKGFAFTLGLTTLIDLVICFFFTHPIVTVLGRTKFWGRGRRGSGLEAAHMGVTESQLLGRRSRRSAPRAKRTVESEEV